jgi:hypothetical protein
LNTLLLTKKRQRSISALVNGFPKACKVLLDRYPARTWSPSWRPCTADVPAWSARTGSSCRGRFVKLTDVTYEWINILAYVKIGQKLTNFYSTLSTLCRKNYHYSGCQENTHFSPKTGQKRPKIVIITLTRGLFKWKIHFKISKIVCTNVKKH